MTVKSALHPTRSRRAPAARRPDFFIVGAPKCGTTALIQYLKQHPQVFVPDRKELDYFGADLQFRWPRLTKEEYLAFFTEAGAAKRAGEGSVWYLYSARAAAEIKAFSPAASIIIMLRNPVDLMYSFHSQRVYNGNEDIEDFAAALAAEEDRRRGHRIPKNASDVMGCYYREIATFTPQIERYVRVFGRDRVRIILFEDFTRDTARVYRETCEFLGIDPGFQPALEVVNARKRIRSTLLRDFVRRPHPGADWLLPLVGLRRTRDGGLKGWIRRINSTTDALRPMDPALRRQLQREFVPEVERLSALLGRDLSHWSAP
jgi:hypothetical protein